MTAKASMRLLVTGATGFVGRAVIARAQQCPGATITAAVRSARSDGLSLTGQVMVGEINSETHWGEALREIDVVIHLAGRAHVMNETTTDPLEAYRAVNVGGTMNLARCAAAAGVKRLVFVSSVKVNGEGPPLGGKQVGRVYREFDVPAPEDAYGISKHEAEVGLRDLARNMGLEVVIVRPPLVYGPGVRANMRALMKAVERGLPLPLGAVTNRRSLVYVDNLADFIMRCAEAPAAANDTFLVSDGEDVSTADLIRRMAKAMGRPARLFPIPVELLRLAARLTGKGAQAQRLLGSLQVDISKARLRLGWEPPIGMDAALQHTAATFS